MTDRDTRDSAQRQHRGNHQADPDSEQRTALRSTLAIAST
jgi:hypothetical protein